MCVITITKHTQYKPLYNIKTSNTTQSDHFQNPIEKSLKETNSIPPTQIHDRSLFWFDICTLIKGGGAKQV